MGAIARRDDPADLQGKNPQDQDAQLQSWQNGGGQNGNAQELETQEQLQEILNRWVATSQLSSQAQNWLTVELLQFSQAAIALGITPANAQVVIEQQLRQVQQVWPVVDSFCRQQLHWRGCPLRTLWLLWLPLANWIRNCWQQKHQLFVQGILGGQGTGKSTLAAILSTLLSQMGLRVCRLSIDDLYLTYAERQALQQQDPRLKWRGPPGTHDVVLGLRMFTQLRSPYSPKTIEIPRFDKSAQDGAGDRTSPELISGADIVLFEGWFVGLRPIDPQLFDVAPPPILTEGDRQFARDCNIRLADYLPLWNQLDSLIVLQPPDYRLSQQWRRQAEQQMASTGRSSMKDAEIDQFVEYFWRSLHPELFLPSLLKQPDAVALVIEVNPDHSPHRIYSTTSKSI